MSLAINSSFSALRAAQNLEAAGLNLQRSLNRLSSGLRINSSSDDAGGLAVSMKLSAEIRRNRAAQENLGNAISFLETQDSVMKVADKVISRMAELSSLALDITKNSGDVANYDKEFQELQSQLESLASERFNGISLFVGRSTGGAASQTTAQALALTVSGDGAQTTSISVAAINTAPWLDMLINGFVSFSDPSNSANRVFVPNAPQDLSGYSETAGNFDLSQTTTVTQTYSGTVVLPAGTLTRSATIPAHTYSGGLVAATTVTVAASISSPSLTNIGGNTYQLSSPPLPGSPYTTNPTYRQLADNLRTGTLSDPLYAGTTSTISVSVNFSPPAVYTRTEDGSTTSAITLDVPSATFSGTQILAPWDDNSLGGSSNASDSSLTQSTAAEFGVVARQALQELAEMRAKNGAEQSGLHFARDLLQTNEVNLTSANSRILDADIAAESLHLARSNILVQGATAMLAQANQSAQSLLKLLL